MSTQVKTAVIAAAGFATRMWPASKVVPKELFPLARVPTIIHLMWEFEEAGISRIVVVVNEETSPLMKSLFSTAPVPADKITDDPWVQRFQQLLAKTEVVLICQTKRYGNGTPLILSADIVGREPCIYAFGDDIVFGENPTRELISIYARTGLPVLATQEVEPNRKCLFGIVECHAENGIQYVSRMMEKPSLTDTPSCLAAFGRYLVTPDLMQTVGNLRPGRDNEVWFSDSIVTWLDNGNRACAFILRRGEWYTVGDAKSYAAAVSAATEQYLAALRRS